MPDPKPETGDFFVTNSGNSLHSLVIKWGTSSTWSHAGIYVGGGQVLEAMPSGARLSPVDTYLGDNTIWSALPLTQGDRLVLGLNAASMIGTPYGWPEIVAVAVAQRRTGRIIDPLVPMDQQPWWVRNLADIHCQICSQLVDYIHLLSGIHLFDDGRPFGLVSPADLAGLT